MVNLKYDIFISYKRKSLSTANNLYYRLTMRGYSTFFDLEEMGRDNFNVQLLNYIENAKDVFVILEEGFLDACKNDNWEEDWFCHEITFALEKKKNIIPILLGDYIIPNEDYFPDKLKELSLKHSPDFSFSFFDAYLDKLIEKKFITSEVHVQNKTASVFKFYSNENCQVFKEGKLVCSLEGLSEEPCYLPVQRKGSFRFKSLNIIGESKIFDEYIEAEEDKIVQIKWDGRTPLVPDQEWPQLVKIKGSVFIVDLGLLKFKMIRVIGGYMEVGATRGQQNFAEGNEYPCHLVNISTFFIGQFPITQNVWELVMGYDKSYYKDKEDSLIKSDNKSLYYKSLASAGAAIASVISMLVEIALLGGIGKFAKDKAKVWMNKQISDNNFGDDYGHYPVENISFVEALVFVIRLSKMTNIKFEIPTEAEWEYAARGGQKNQGYIYAGSNDIDEVAWHRGNADNSTHPVGLKKPNEIGLYDMSGNVWEWTGTLAHSYASDVETNGTVFIRRGGSWWHEAKNCRVSRRYASDHSKKTSGLVTRVVIRGNVEF